MSTFTVQEVAALLQGVQRGGSKKKMGSTIDKLIDLANTNSKKFTPAAAMQMVGKGDSNRVRKPPNAWQLFVRDFKNREGVIPDRSTGADIVKLASPVWEKMGEGERKPFVEEAEKLSAGYKEDKAKSKGVQKKPVGAKRPQNAWMLFLTKYRVENAEPGVAGSVIVGRAGAVWKEMGEEERVPFTNEASKLSDAYKAAKGDVPNNSDPEDSDEGKDKPAKKEKSPEVNKKAKKEKSEHSPKKLSKKEHKALEVKKAEEEALEVKKAEAAGEALEVKKAEAAGEAAAKALLEAKKVESAGEDDSNDSEESDDDTGSDEE